MSSRFKQENNKNTEERRKESGDLWCGELFNVLESGDSRIDKDKEEHEREEFRRTVKEVHVVAGRQTRRTGDSWLGVSPSRGREKEDIWYH